MKASGSTSEKYFKCILFGAKEVAFDRFTGWRHCMGNKCVKWMSKCSLGLKAVVYFNIYLLIINLT